MPGVLVPYRGRAGSLALYRHAAGSAMRARRFTSVGPYARARAMYTASRAAYTIGRGVVKAVRRRRAAKARARRAVGEPLRGRNNGTICQRTGVLLATNQLYPTRTLNFTPLILQDRNALGTNLSERNRDVINLRGIKICIEIRNTQSSTPLYVNMAIIKMKRNFNNSVPTGTDSAYTSFGDWFRSDGGDVRSLDFNDQTTAIQSRCLPLNADGMEILMHQRILLTPSDPDVGTHFWNMQYGANWRIMEKYIPIKRKITFPSANDNVPTDGQVFFVHWAQFPMAGTGTPTLDAYAMSRRILMYWRNVQG